MICVHGRELLRERCRACEVPSRTVVVADTAPAPAPCPVCGAARFRCAGGVSCERGHGFGLDDVPDADALPWGDEEYPDPKWTGRAC